MTKVTSLIVKCVQCDAEEFECQDIKHFPTVKQEIVEVITPTDVCKRCGLQQLSDEQVDILRLASIDRYREKHDLLTSQNMNDFREALGMSQKSFMEYLNRRGSGLKLWETYHIQDASQDDHIRLKCDPHFAEYNLFLLQHLIEKPNIFNGMKKFSLDLFRQTALFFIKNTNSSGKFLPNLLFYADFLNFKKHNKSITGNRYLPFKSGPYPYQWNLILEMAKSIKPSENGYQSVEEPDMSLFDDAEKRTINCVCDSYNNKTQCLVRMSQQEQAYTDVKPDCFISYSHATNLLI